MIRAELEFNKKNSRLVIKCPEANLDDRRHVGGAEQRLFSRWIDSYRLALRSHDNHSVLSRIGQEIYNWLNGTASWLEAFFTSSTNPPFILECRVPPNPKEDELRFLEVPWELLADQDDHYLAEDQYIIYCPVRRIGNPMKPEKPSPFLLHTIFMAATPLGSVSLRYEEEEFAILDAAGTAGMDLTVEESGTLNLLAECMSREMREHPVDVLHISCHGDHKGGPVLLLENEEGKPCHTTAYQFDQKLGSHKPKLLFLSACMTSEPDSLLNSFSADMVRRGISAVLGWGGAVKDMEATRFASFFYGRLSLCEELEEALARSRLDLLGDVQKKSSDQRARDWHLARLYLGGRGGGVLSKGQIPWRSTKPDYAHEEFLDAKGAKIPVATHEEFVGRRRQIQTILKEFNSPTHAGVLIHGFGGQGKSSLAARIAYRQKDHQLVVIYGCYNALSILDTIEDHVGNTERNDLIASQKDAVRSDPKLLFVFLKEILEGPCLRVEKDDKGKVIRRPLLLVIDDFEQILESPHQEELHKVRSDLVNTVRSIIRAFEISIKEAKTLSRLLITSRYRFALYHKEQNLTSKLLHVHLPSMEEFESRKQVASKEKIMGLSESTIDLKRVEQCIHTAGGNPWLQDMFVSLCREAPQECDKALISTEEYIKYGHKPKNTKLLGFIEKLEIQRLINSLSFDEKELLRISTLFQIPVPLAIFEFIAKNLGVTCPEPFCDRLLGFGLWEPISDMVNPDYKAVSICTMVRPLAGQLKENESTKISCFVVKDLFEMWGGVKKGNRPYTADIQLARLALEAKESIVLTETAKDAVRGLEKRFQYKDAARLGEDAIQILDEACAVVPSPLLRAASEVSEIIGDFEKAQAYIKRALDTLVSQRETDEYAYTLITYGGQLVKIGDLNNAHSIFIEAENILKSDRFLRGRSIVIGEIARLKAKMGELAEALKEHEEELEVYKQLGDRRSQAVTKGDIARILIKLGEVDKALKLHMEQLDFFREIGDPRSQAIVNREIASIMFDRGEVVEALEIYHAQLKEFEKLGDLREKAITIGDIARVMYGKEEYDEALKLYKEELEIYKQLGELPSQTIAMGDIAHVLVKKGKLNKALRLHKEELQVYDKLNDKSSRAYTLGDIARILVKKGKFKKALNLQLERLQISKEIKSPSSEAAALWDLGKIELEQKNHRKAFDYLKNSYNIFRKLGNQRMNCRVMLDIGRLLCIVGRTKKGIKFLKLSRDGFKKMAQEKRAELAQKLIEECSP